MLYLDSKDRQERLDVNKVLEDKKEGKLYEAPFTGTLYFGVKDVNGSYDDSGQHRSHYSLSFQNLPTLPEDESSIDKPIEIKLPYSSDNETYRLLGSEGDDDYFYSQSKRHKWFASIFLLFLGQIRVLGFMT